MAGLTGFLGKEHAIEGSAGDITAIVRLWTSNWPGIVGVRRGRSVEGRER
jgi:hypothetical protein